MTISCLAEHVIHNISILPWFHHKWLKWLLWQDHSKLIVSIVTPKFVLTCFVRRLLWLSLTTSLITLTYVKLHASDRKSKQKKIVHCFKDSHYNLFIVQQLFLVKTVVAMVILQGLSLTLVVSSWDASSSLPCPPPSRAVSMAQSHSFGPVTLNTVTQYRIAKYSTACASQTRSAKWNQTTRRFPPSRV